MIYKTLKGFSDIYGDDISLWHSLESIISNLMNLYGFSEIRTPILERTELFIRGVGDVSDAVGKEMYTFNDKSTPPESISIRPELTAPVARAFIQHDIGKQQLITKWYYVGASFRYEQPQKGRTRQYHTFGVELIGSHSAIADAEVISIGYDLLKLLGINNFKLRINSLGYKEERIRYREALVDYFNSIKSQLSEDSKNRIESNPLRILDSKNEYDAIACVDAPSILDFLNEESLEHFDRLKNLLDENEVEYIVDKRLVRGLDYYTRTVFEFQTKSLGSQDALGGGGRYDNLIAEIGGNQTPATGFGFGMERLILVSKLENGLNVKGNNCFVYIVSLGEKAQLISSRLAHKIRLSNKSVEMDLMNRSMKAQLREASKLNCKYVIIIGEDEIETSIALVKNMETWEQKNIAFDEILNELNF